MMCASVDAVAKKVKGARIAPPDGVNPLDTSIRWAHFGQLMGDLFHRTAEDIGPLSAYVGLSGTGKTTILNYPRLSIHGKVPEAETHLAGIARLEGANPETGWHVEAAGADGIARFTCPPSGNTILSPFTGKLAALEDYRDTLIVSDVPAMLLSGSSDTGTDAFLRLFGAHVPMPEIELLDPMRELWDEATTSQGDDPLTAADLAAILAWAKAELLAASKSAKVVRAKMEGAREATRAADMPNTDDLRAAYEHALQWEAHETLDRLAPLVAQHEAALKLRRVTLLRDWFAAVGAPLAHSHPTDAPCMMCGRPGLTADDIVGIGLDFDDLLAKRQRECPAGVEAVLAAVATHEATLTTLNGAPRPAQAPVASAAHYKDLMTQVRVARKGDTAVGEYRTQLSKLSERHESLSVLINLLQRARTTVLTPVAEAARSRLAGLMYDVVPVVEVRDKRLVWSIVGKHGGVSRRGWRSGRENALLELALGIVTAPTSFRLMLLDDDRLGRFDKFTLPEYLDVLASAQRNNDITQLICAWNRPDEIEHLTRAGYLVVST